MAQSEKIEKAYRAALERYGDFGVDARAALARLDVFSISLHCWQGDDVGGFERPDAVLSGGGIQVTGDHPGAARTVDELRMDLDKAYSLIPGLHRLNLHAIYGEFGGRTVDRDAIDASLFQGWMEWGARRGIKLDFNATCFSHPKADGGFTLSHRDRGIRDFWIEHVKRCRRISAAMGEAQGSESIHNLWIPDGSKDLPADRWIHRKLLAESLDRIFEEALPPKAMKDSLESKLFGIGTESFVVGSHEFYLGYALSRDLMVCLDLGHFHPTESVADKISAVLQFTDEILLHVSRGVRWDSDHVVILNDEVLDLAREIVRVPNTKRIHIALDFFDATMNRIGAWVIGMHAMQKALLCALLEPRDRLVRFEEAGNFFARLALLEEAKTLPFGDLWNYFCQGKGVPVGEALLKEVHDYEEKVARSR